MEFVGVIVGIIILAFLSYFWHMFWAGRRKKARDAILATAAEALKQADAFLEQGDPEQALQECEKAMVFPDMALSVRGSGAGAVCAAHDEARQFSELLSSFKTHYLQMLDRTSRAHEAGGGSFDNTSFDALISLAVGAAENVVKMQVLGNLVLDAAFDRKDVARDILNDLHPLARLRLDAVLQLLEGVKSCLSAGTISEEVSQLRRPWMAKDYDDSRERAKCMVERWKEAERTLPNVTKDEIADGASVESLRSALSCTAHDVRAAAAEALGKSGGKDDIARLAPLVEDPCYSVQIAAIGALASIGGQEALDAIRPATVDPEVEVADSATRVLTRLAT